MKRISFLVLAFANAGMLVHADTEHTDNTHALEHVIVTMPFQRLEAETALPITVLSGDELRNTATATLGDTLNLHPGLTTASFGPGVGQPVIRGQQGPRVAVLQNSLLVGDASNISADHAVAVEPVLANSIEVLRGPSTLLYGGGAIGGLVNVIDNRIPTKLDPISAAIELRHGSVNDESTGVFRLDGSEGNVAFHFDALKRQSNDVEIPGDASNLEDEDDDGHDEDGTHGFIENTDTDQQAFTVGGSYIFSRGMVGLAFNQIENNYGIPPAAHGHEEDDPLALPSDEDEEELIRIDMEKKRTDFRFSLNELSPFFESVDWKASYSDYRHVELEGDEIGTEFTNELWQNRIQLTHAPIGQLHGVLGFQQSSSDFSALGDESFIPKSTTDTYGVFLVENIHTENTTIEFGLRADQTKINMDADVPALDAFTAISASASVLWHFSESLHGGVAFSHSERAPVVEELLSNVDREEGDEFVVHAATNVIEVGSTALDTEKSNNIDLSLSWEYNSNQGFVTLFYNDFSDYIYLQDTSLEQDDVTIFAYQQTNAEFVGVEAEAEFSVSKVIRWRIFGDYITGELDQGLNVPRIPPARLGMAFEFEKNVWAADLSVINAFDQDDISPFETPTDGWTRVDASLKYRFENKTQDALIFLKIKNLGNEEIRNSVSFLKDVAPEAGRSIELGFRMSI